MTTIRLAAVALIALASIAAIALEEPTPTPPEATQEQQEDSGSEAGDTKSGQATSEQATIPVDESDTAVDTEGGGDGRNDGNQESGPSRIELFTGVLAVVAVLQLGLFAFQLFLLKKQWGATRTQSGSMLDTVAIARQNTRAYVVLDEYTPSAAPTAGEPFSVELTFKNVGQTPALDAELSTGIVIAPTSDRLREIQHGESGTKSASVIGAGQLRSVRAFLNGNINAVIDEADIRAIADHQVRIQLIGVCQYRDVFGDTHTTTAHLSYLMRWTPPLTSSASKVPKS